MFNIRDRSPMVRHPLLQNKVFSNYKSVTSLLDMNEIKCKNILEVAREISVLLCLCKYFIYYDRHHNCYCSYYLK